MHWAGKQCGRPPMSNRRKAWPYYSFAFKRQHRESMTDSTTMATPGQRITQYCQICGEPVKGTTKLRSRQRCCSAECRRVNEEQNKRVFFGPPRTFREERHAEELTFVDEMLLDLNGHEWCDIV